MSQKVFDRRADHQRKRDALLAQVAGQPDTPIGLRRPRSNLFRHRKKAVGPIINTRQFDEVIYIDVKNARAEVEGMTTYDTLVQETLRHGFVPTVVPELKTITLGGATTGIGVESSSFRYGFVHETVQELELILGDGRMVCCRHDNEHADLFRGFPNSYGTLGYALKVVVKLQPATKYVRLRHQRCNTYATFLEVLGRECADRDAHAFVDGVAFSANELYVTVGDMVDEAPYTSDYTYRRIYYRSIQNRAEDYLTTYDYIWRWDTDWFWCSKHFGAQVLPIRLLAGRRLLKSSTYWAIRSWAARSGVTDLVEKVSGRTIAVIQDVEIPLEGCQAFLEFFAKEIGITPVWACPVRQYDPGMSFDLYKTKPETLYVNFGFWDMVPSDKPADHFDRLIEDKVEELGGRKSLYSTSTYSEERFWQIYNRPAYDALKAKYDPTGRLRDLYQKCVVN